MKRRLAYITLTSALFLSACGTNDTESAPEEEITDTTETEDQNDSGSSSDETEVNEDENEADAETDTENEEDEDLTTNEENEAEFLYEVNPELSTIEVIDGKEANAQVALLTYDDVPDDYALDIAEILYEKEAPAIFFVNGMYIESDEGQEALREIHEMGFEIGNHTHTHPNLSTIDEENQTEEILKTSDLIEEVIGERPRFFRAPHGVNTDHSRDVVQNDGMTLMNWTYGYDYFEPYMDSDKLTEAMVSGEAPEIDIDYSLLQPGANLLMHDREWTMEATPDIIDGLREKEYELVDPALIRSEAIESEEN